MSKFLETFSSFIGYRLLGHILIHPIFTLICVFCWAGDFGQFHHWAVCFVHECWMSGWWPAHHRIRQAGRVWRLVRHILGACPLLQRDEFHYFAGPVVHAIQSGQHRLQLWLPTGLQNAQPEPRGRPVWRAKNVCE